MLLKRHGDSKYFRLAIKNFDSEDKHPNYKIFWHSKSFIASFFQYSVPQNREQNSPMSPNIENYDFQHHFQSLVL